MPSGSRRRVRTVDDFFATTFVPTFVPTFVATSSTSSRDQK
jgi:hypothetical protein